MKKLMLLSLFFVSTLLSAQKPIEIKLWPDGAPNSNGMTQQVENGPTYVAEPTLTVYPAKESNGLAIVACPGGGYAHLALSHEGHDMASWFNSQGITYAVLKYRMPNGNNERYHGIVCWRASGKHGRHAYYGFRDTPRFPDSFLPCHHDGSHLYPYGVAR